MPKITRLLLVLCVVLLSSCTSQRDGDKFISTYAMPKTHPDAVLSRKVAMMHPASGEQVFVTYFQNGQYDAEAMRAVNKLFRDRKANVVGKIDPELIDFLVDIRIRLGLPDEVMFQILDGYRTDATNRRLAATNGNVAKESLHKHGWAVDFRIAGVDGRAIQEIAKTMQRGGVAFYPRDNHVHIDLGNIRTWKQR